MPAQSVKERVQAMVGGNDQEQMRALIGAVVDALQAVASKLDADAGVTDTNYRAVVDAIVVD